MSDKRQQAYKLVDDFAARAPAGGAFVYISRETVAAGLRARIGSPYMINQKGSSLCAPAALVADLASSDPERYVQFVIALYEKGEAKLGKLDIRPGIELKTYSLSGVRNSPDAADWIPLASIRDSSNWILSYQEVGDQIAGITIPGTLAQWASDIGYTKVIDKTLPFPTEINKNLWEAAVRHESDGYKIFLLINSSLLDPEPTVGHGSWPNHWVLLLSAIINNDGSAKLQIYTWGQKRLVPPSGMVPADVIRMHYFGFVAAKY